MILSGLEGDDTRKTYKGVGAALGMGSSVLKSVDADSEGIDDAAADVMEVAAHFFGHLGAGNVSNAKAAGEAAKKAIDKVVERIDAANSETE